MPHTKAHSGINWFYEIEGEGEPLIFIHGWGVDRRIWRQQYKFFSDHYRVFSMDLPGHGETSWEKLSLEDMSKDLHIILKSLGLHPITTVGSSLGGLVALKLYELEPEIFSRMVFVGALPKFARSEGYPYGLDVKQMRHLGKQLDRAYPSIIDIFFRSLFTKHERRTRRYRWLQKFRQKQAGAPIKPALTEYLDLLEQEDLRDVLEAAVCPIQFINGTHDDICSLKAVEYLQDLKSDAQFDLFENCGHFPFLSQPHEFNEALQKFLTKTSYGISSH